ncbi:MAG: hypothetical protein ABH986_04980 [archaeon]
MKITRTGIKRVYRGRKGITKKEIETARKNTLWIAKNKAREEALSSYRKQIKELEKHADTPEKEFELNAIKLIAKMVEEKNAISQPHFSRAIVSRGIEFSVSIATKYGLDAIGEFNPETRRHIRKQMEKIRNAFERREIFSGASGAKAAKEIEKTLGKRKARLFLRKYNKTARRLHVMLEKLVENTPFKELIS